MKRWTYRPKDGLGGPERDRRLFAKIDNRRDGRKEIEQSILLRGLMPEIRHLLLFASALVAEDESLTRILVRSVIRIDRRMIARKRRKSVKRRVRTKLDE